MSYDKKQRLKFPIVVKHHHHVEALGRMGAAVSPAHESRLLGAKFDGVYYPIVFNVISGHTSLETASI